MGVYLTVMFMLVMGQSFASSKIVHHNESCEPCQCYMSRGKGIVADCSNQHLRYIPSTIPHEVNYFYLQHNIFKEIYPHLGNFTNLVYLDLSSNCITDLHVDSFIHNIRLGFLNLHDNQIPLTKEAYPEGLFRRQKHLFSLDLSKNADLHGTNLSYPEEALGDLVSLQSLSIDGINNALFGEGFSNLTLLSRLTLSGHRGYCVIRRLSNKTFYHLHHLKHLDISKCFILDIDRSAFEPLINIDILDMSDNPYLGLKNFGHSLYGLQNSTIRVLHANKIVQKFAIGVELKVKHILHLQGTNLKHLSFDYNRLELIDAEALKYLSCLETVSIKGNRFTFGLYLLSTDCMTNVTEIHASHQYTSEKVTIRREGDERFDRTELERICKSCSLNNSIPSDKGKENTSILFNTGDTHENTREKSLDPAEYHTSDYIIDDNCLNTNHLQVSCVQQQEHYNLKKRTDSPEFIIPLPKTLKFLNASRSKLSYEILNYTLYENTVQRIDISKNLFTKWHGPIYPLDQLEFLDLSDNYCNYISFAFLQSLYNLLTLNISKNYLSSSLSNDNDGQIFQNLSKLMTLRIAHNEVGYLPPKIFRNLDNLVLLDLSWNALSVWNVDIAHMRQLKELDLSYNRFEEIPRTLRDQINGITNNRHQIRIQVLGNSLKCNCRTIDSLQWMVYAHVNFTDLAQTTCRFENDTEELLLNPEDVILQLQLHCKAIMPIIFGVVAGLLFFFAVSISGMVYRYRWRLRYLYYTTRRKYRGYQRLREDEDNFTYDAFISYADEDRAFVVEDMRDTLEKNFALRLCIHHRDFMVGQAITDNIINAIQSSRKTVVILSPNFLKSSWCKYEVTMARFESIYSGRDVLCVVWYADLEENREIPNDLLEEISTGTYLKYPKEDVGYPLFWQSLKDAVSH